MLKKVIISENERGILFCNGRYKKLLSPGKYYLFGDREIEIAYIDRVLSLSRCSLETLLADPEAAKNLDVVEIKDREVAIHYVDGKFESLLRRGKYAFWNMTSKHDFVIVDITSPTVSPDVPEYIFSKIPSHYYHKFEVAEYQKARLYFDNKLVGILDAGTHYYWNNGMSVTADFVDTRLTQMDITGQEMLTADKVALRVNFVLNYRITDYVKILTDVDDYKEQMHVLAQLALRDYIGKYKLDEILENKDQLSKCVLERLKERERDLYVEIFDAGVKDVILPGEIRDIMNTVLIAEKRAQANVITRREEVASTRSLLNTARLMDENKTLYKLKELEYVERICENVGNINLGNGGDLLTQLTEILRGK